jgi:maltose alpha-D-glucosyltransferase/alpha-amylase
MRNVLFDVMDKLSREKRRIPEEIAHLAERVRTLQPALLKEFRGIAEQPIAATRIRCPANLHLHQILFTGKDFVFADFEGAAEQSLGERRIKRSPLRDVITLVRSFDYAAYATLYGLVSRRGKAAGAVRDEDRPGLLLWALAWRSWVHHALVDGYLTTCAGASFVPDNSQSRNTLFRTLLLDTLLMETSNTLRSLPNWVGIPLHGLLEVLGGEVPTVEPAGQPRG